MQICTVKNIDIGNGTTKICVPIVDTTHSEILQSAQAIKQKNPDIIEFRADFFEHLYDTKKLHSLLNNLNIVTQDLPLIFTIRTKPQGGNIDISPEQYFEIIDKVIQKNNIDIIDIIDIECIHDRQKIKEIINNAKKNNIKIICSYHNNTKTPEQSELSNIIDQMQSLNADIYKIAVMPKNKKDVLELMQFSQNISKKINKPIVAISMGILGKITRISCDLMNSSITFASSGKSSDIGQIDINELKTILSIMRK